MKAVGLALVAVLAGLTTACGSSGGSKVDDPNGVKACQMMLADKRSGLTPDDDRSAQEVTLLAGAKNADLKRAGSRLANSHTDVQMNAIGDLYTGCAAVGVKLN
jgi:hypothetical protein